MPPVIVKMGGVMMGRLAAGLFLALVLTVVGTGCQSSRFGERMFGLRSTGPVGESVLAGDGSGAAGWRIPTSTGGVPCAVTGCAGCEQGVPADGMRPVPTSTVNYPYYTLRGPRDFLAKNPPSIGP